MKDYPEIQGTIDSVAKDGSGIIAENSRPVHVYNTVPGEVVKAKPFKRVKKALRADLVEIVSSSPDRVEPRCPYAAECGGCKWQHIDYEAQTRIKLEQIQNVFKETEMEGAPDSMMKAPEIFYYRNRMDYIFSWKGEMGLRAPGAWWKTIDLEECYLLSKEAVEVMAIVRAWSRDKTFWDQKRREGFLRYLVMREGKNTGERMVMILTSDAENGHENVSKLSEQLGDLATSVVWGISDHRKDDSFAKEVRAIKGDPWIMEEVNGLRYKITPNAFFQTNTKMAEELQNVVKRFCGDLTGKTLLDLYCGSGFFALALADEAKRVLGIELVDEAIQAAKENAERNDKTAEFAVSAAEEFDWQGVNPDVVILDPPRSGLHPKTLKTVLQELPETIVYVSCNYRKFVEELTELSKHYIVSDSVALDLFPHTPHAEIVVKLERCKK